MQPSGNRKNLPSPKAKAKARVLASLTKDALWTGGALRSVVPLDTITVSPTAGWLHKSVAKTCESKYSPSAWRKWGEESLALGVTIYRKVERPRVGKIDLQPVFSSEGVDDCGDDAKDKAAEADASDGKPAGGTTDASGEAAADICSRLASELTALDEQEPVELPDTVEDTQAVSPQAAQADKRKTVVLPALRSARNSVIKRLASRVSILEETSTDVAADLGDAMEEQAGRRTSRVSFPSEDRVAYHSGSVEEESDDEEFTGHRHSFLAKKRNTRRLRLIERKQDEQKRAQECLHYLEGKFNELPGKEIAAVKAAFEAFDEDDDDLLTVEELCSCVIELGLGGTSVAERHEMAELCRDLAEHSVDARTRRHNEMPEAKPKVQVVGRGVSFMSADSEPTPQSSTTVLRSSLSGDSMVDGEEDRRTLTRTASIESFTSAGGMAEYDSYEAHDSEQGTRRAISGETPRNMCRKPMPADGGGQKAALKRKSTSKAPGYKVTVQELALQLLPALRQSQTIICGDRLRKMLAHQGQADITVDQPPAYWAHLAWRMGVDPRLYTKVADYLLKNSSERAYTACPGNLEQFVSAAPLRNSSSGLKVGSGKNTPFEVAARAVARCRELVLRARKRRERELQKLQQVDDGVFDDLRPILLDLYERYAAMTDQMELQRSKPVVARIFKSLMKEFGFVAPHQHKSVVSALEADQVRSQFVTSVAGVLTLTFSALTETCHESREARAALAQEKKRKLLNHYFPCGQGTITMQQASGVLHRHNLIPRTRDEQRDIELMFLDLDTCGSGEFRKQEFNLLFGRIQEHLQRNHWDALATRAMNLGLSEGDTHDLLDAFEMEDMNGFGTGLVSLGQVRNVMTKTNRHPSQDELVQAAEVAGLRSGDETVDFYGLMYIASRLQPAEDDNLPPVDAMQRVKSLLGARKQLVAWAKPHVMRRALRCMQLPKDYILALSPESLQTVWIEYVNAERIDETTSFAMVLTRLNIRNVKDFMVLSQEVGRQMLLTEAEFAGLPGMQAIVSNYVCQSLE
eukprot:TRINITY_DN31687_c0_g1_i2.p1 TRINITY_DN31687_c0_g1~~TRINITY_DN31687_c0_g1_i2.p1  ORF type:complete len:1031 (-),score=268.99 TRINITY_DN31687_c0_g1_i2:111-3203(-)